MSFIIQGCILMITLHLVCIYVENLENINLLGSETNVMKDHKNGL